MVQLFDLKNDPSESHDLAADPALAGVRSELEQLLIGQLYGRDLEWVKDGRLADFEAPVYREKADYGLYNQRSYHWPTPTGYSNKGKNA